MIAGRPKAPFVVIDSGVVLLAGRVGVIGLSILHAELAPDVDDVVDIAKRGEASALALMCAVGTGVGFTRLSFFIEEGICWGTLLIEYVRDEGGVEVLQGFRVRARRILSTVRRVSDKHHRVVRDFMIIAGLVPTLPPKSLVREKSVALKDLRVRESLMSVVYALAVERLFTE